MLSESQDADRRLQELGQRECCSLQGTFRTISTGFADTYSLDSNNFAGTFIEGCLLGTKHPVPQKSRIREIMSSCKYSLNLHIWILYRLDCPFRTGAAIIQETRTDGFLTLDWLRNLQIRHVYFAQCTITSEFEPRLSQISDGLRFSYDLLEETLRFYISKNTRLSCKTITPPLSPLIVLCVSASASLDTRHSSR